MAVGDNSVTVNVGGGVCRIKPAKLYMYMQKDYKYNEDGRTAPGARATARPWFRSPEPLGERRYENWITTRSNLAIFP